MKKCFKCHKVKQLTEFYKHSGMKDGHLGKCKECTKKDVTENRELKREQYSEYEKIRNKTEKRKQQKLKYQKTRRAKYPQKYKTRNATNNAISSGKLKKEPCEKCGEKNSEAHHNDYSNPFDITWLCFKHHRELHGQVVIG